jgi:general stress protein YciG
LSRELEEFFETFAAARHYISGYGIPEESKAMSAVETTKKSATSTRGFASMDPEKQRAIARKGGESVPHEKRSFSQNPGLAAEAGRKGGQSVNPTKRSFSRNHALASEAGRKGGHASHGGPKKAITE